MSERQKLSLADTGQIPLPVPRRKLYQPVARGKRLVPTSDGSAQAEAEFCAHSKILYQSQEAAYADFDAFIARCVAKGADADSLRLRIAELELHE